MDAVQGWLDAQERGLAAPETVGELEQLLPLLLAVSWTLLLGALYLHVKSSLRGWVLPRLQAGSLQLLLILTLAALSPSVAVCSGEPSAFGTVSGLLFTGFAHLLAGVSLPHRVAITCMPLADLHAYLARPRTLFQSTLGPSRIGLLGATLLLVFRPVAVLAWLLPGQGTESEPSHIFLDLALLVLGSAAVWFAGCDSRRDLLGEHLPHYGLVYYCVAAMCWAWELQSLMMVSLEWSPETFALFEAAKVFEVAVVVICAAAALAPQRDPLVQMALTRERHRADAESEDLLREWHGVWHARGEAFLQTVDALRPLREAMETLVPRQAATWQPLAEEVEATGNSEDEADARAEAEAKLCNLERLEAQRGRRAWRAWSSSSGVHPYWMGARDHGGTLKVVSPLRLTQQEQLLYKEGKLRPSTTWHYVFVDLFTDRVQSKPLAVVVVVIVAFYAYRLDFNGWLTDRLPNPALVLAANIGILAVIWLLVGLALLGNNPFLCCRWAYSLWALVVGTLLLVLSSLHCLRLLLAPEDWRQPLSDGTFAERLEDRWFDFSMAFLALLGGFLAYRVAAQPQGRSDFHRSEMSALWYASSVLRPPGAVLELRRNRPQMGEELVYIGRSTEGEMPAFALEDHENGTCDVMLKDGRKYHSVRYKHLERRAKEGQLAEERADRRLRRLKRILSAAEEFPPTLYFGAVAVAPLLMTLACGMLQAVKGVLHRVYQVHVLASLLNFCLFAYVAPAGPGIPGNATLLGGQSQLAGQAAPPLYFRWDDGALPDAAPSVPCEDLALGQKILITVFPSGRGDEAVSLTWSDVSGSIDNMLASWGFGSLEAAGQEAPSPTRAAVQNAWLRVTGKDGRLRLDAASLGRLACAAKFEFGSSRVGITEELVYTSVWDVAMVVKRHYEGENVVAGPFVHRIVRKALKWMVQELQMAGFGRLMKELVILDKSFAKDPGSIKYLGGHLKNLTKTALQILDMREPSISSQAHPYFEGASKVRHVAKEATVIPTKAAPGVRVVGASAPAGRRLVDQEENEDREQQEQRSRAILEELEGIVLGNEPSIERLFLADSDGDGFLGFADEVPLLLEQGEKVCGSMNCGTNLEGRMWSAFVQADGDGDGRASKDELRRATKRLKAILTHGGKRHADLCGRGGLGSGPEAVTEALRLLDEDGDGTINVAEALEAVKTVTAGVAREEGGIPRVSPSGLLMAAFARDDRNADGRLEAKELEDGGFARSLGGACPSRPPTASPSVPQHTVAKTLAPSAPAPAATLPSEAVAPPAAVAQPVAAPVAAAVPPLAERSRTAQAAPAPLAASDTAPPGGAAAALLGSPVFGTLAAVLGPLQQDYVVWALIGVEGLLYISIFCASMCELVVVGRCFSTYRRLFEEMQAGSHNYLGHESRQTLEKGFAEITVLPGVLLGTCAIGFVLVTCFVFLLFPVLGLLVGVAAACLTTLKYLVLALALKKFIKAALLDWLLVDEGDVVYPGTFSLFWFIQLFLNFVIGIPAAVARVGLVMSVAALSCCLVDVTVLPESLVSLDAAYYSLLAMVYTRHDRRNPLKVAGTTAFLRRVHRAYGPMEDTVAGSASRGKARAQRRVRARLWLAITLHRNPELKAFRRHGTMEGQK